MPSRSRASRRAAAAKLAAALGPIEARYVRGLRSIMRALADRYMAVVLPYVVEVKQDSVAIAQMNAARNASLPTELDVLGVKARFAIRNAVGPLFDRMARDVSKVNARGFGLFGITVKDTGVAAHVARARDENIALVEKAGRVYAANVRAIVDDPEAFGARVETVKARLLERGDISESRAELIARDQTLKLNGAIAQERMQNAGVEGYIWSTSRDERVREEHAAVEGQRFSWDDGPEFGHPGEDINCRCIAIPSTPELDEIYGGD